jgi:hypothetical protein
MAYTVNGFGTALYGRREKRKDDSYITTEWVVLAFVPIIPIRSMRIQDSPGDQGVHGMGFRSKFLVYEKTRPNLKQVLSVYGFLMLVALWAYLIITIATYIYSVLNRRGYDDSHLYVSWGFAIFTLWIPFLIPIYARKKAENEVIA